MELFAIAAMTGFSAYLTSHLFPLLSLLGSAIASKVGIDVAVFGGRNAIVSVAKISI